MLRFGYQELMLSAIVPAMVMACWSDCRRHRVPNWLNLGLAVTGVAAQVAFAGWPGLRTAALGMALALAVLLVPWLMHVMGAGDVKFMAALGAWLGPQMTVYALVAGGLAGGVVALALIVYRRVWWQATANVGVLLTKMGSLQTAFSEFGSAESLGRSTGLLPYAVPLSVGTAIVLWSHYLGWWEGL
jgi:prepilin peptidase CpaA